MAVFLGYYKSSFCENWPVQRCKSSEKKPKSHKLALYILHRFKAIYTVDPSPILVNKRLNLFAQSFEFLFSVSHNS